jgi:hypothetical protein
MTTTLDGKTLTVTSISETLEVIATEYDQWNVTDYTIKRKLFVRGSVRNWAVVYVEDNVNWTSGSAVSFQATASAGSAVTFAITDQVRVISTTVKIKKVNIGPIEDLAGKNIRYVTLELLETS